VASGARGRIARRGSREYRSGPHHTPGNVQPGVARRPQATPALQWVQKDKKVTRQEGGTVAIKKQHPEQPNWDDIPGVDVLTEEEGHAFFDRCAREELGISGEEFLRRWDAGEIGPVPDTPEGWKTGRLIMMLPFAGRPLP